jgi:hypothetical protein
MLAHSNESKQVNIEHGGNNNPNVALNRNISIILEQDSSNVSSMTTIDNRVGEGQCGVAVTYNEDVRVGLYLYVQQVPRA